MVMFLDTKATIVRQIAWEVAAEKGEELKKLAQQALLPAPAVCIGDPGPLLKESALMALAHADRYNRKEPTCLIVIPTSSALGKVPTEKRYAAYCQVKQLQSQCMV